MPSISVIFMRLTTFCASSRASGIGSLYSSDASAYAHFAFGRQAKQRLAHNLFVYIGFGANGFQTQYWLPPESGCSSLVQNCLREDVSTMFPPLAKTHSDCPRAAEET